MASYDRLWHSFANFKKDLAIAYSGEADRCSVVLATAVPA
jgi:hypothetical protein